MLWLTSTLLQEKKASPECTSITVDFLVASKEPSTYIKRHFLHLFMLLGHFPIVLHSSMFASQLVPTVNYLIQKYCQAQNIDFAWNSFCRFFFSLNNNYPNFIFLANLDNHCHHKMNGNIPKRNTNLNCQEICKNSNSFWLAPKTFSTRQFLHSFYGQQ